MIALLPVNFDAMRFAALWTQGVHFGYSKVSVTMDQELWHPWALDACKCFFRKR